MSDPTTRHSSVHSQSVRSRGILGNISSMSLFSRPSQKSGRQVPTDAESGLAVANGAQGPGLAAPEERSIELVGKGKVVSSPFDTPSTNTPLTTKGSQNTSLATGTRFCQSVLLVTRLVSPA